MWNAVQRTTAGDRLSNERLQTAIAFACSSPPPSAAHILTLRVGGGVARDDDEASFAGAGLVGGGCRRRRRPRASNGLNGRAISALHFRGVGASGLGRE